MWSGRSCRKSQVHQVASTTSCGLPAPPYVPFSICIIFCSGLCCYHVSSSYFADLGLFCNSLGRSGLGTSSFLLPPSCELFSCSLLGRETFGLFLEPSQPSVTLWARDERQSGQKQRGILGDVSNAQLWLLWGVEEARRGHL